MSIMHLKSLANWQFVQHLVGSNMIENIKVPNYCPFGMEYTSHKRIYLTKSQYCGKSFHVTIMKADKNMTCHQMETFSTLLAICAGNSPVTGELPAQRPVMRSLDVFFDLRLIKWLIKQSWGWWFEMPSHPLWHHCNELPVKNQGTVLILRNNDMCNVHVILDHVITAPNWTMSCLGTSA